MRLVHHLALVALCVIAASAGALAASQTPSPPQPPPVGKADPAPQPITPPPVGKSDPVPPPQIPPPVGSSGQQPPQIPPPVSQENKPKRMITAVISSHPATIVSPSEIQQLQSSSGATAGGSLQPPRAPSFRSLRSRVGVDPIVRKNSCPSGCLPAPRTSRDDGSSDPKAHTEQGSAGSIANQLAPGQDTQLSNKGDGQTETHSTNASPGLPRCPSGCMNAPEL